MRATSYNILIDRNACDISPFSVYNSDNMVKINQKSSDFQPFIKNKKNTIKTYMYKIVNNTTCTVLLTAYITASLIVHVQAQQATAPRAYSNIDACTPSMCDTIYEASAQGPALPDCSRYTDNLELIKAFDYDCSLVNIMQAIAQAESSNDPKAINNRNTNGSIDVGLLQINTIHRDKGESIAHFKTRMLNQSQNIIKAKHIYNTQGLKAWVTYNTGAYTQYLK